MAKAVALLSGGLDSQLAVRLMLEQGIEVECLTSVSVFHQHSDDPPAVPAASRLGVPITLIRTDEQMIDMVRHPRHGLGKNMNPCIDCRIFLLKTAFAHMRRAGADFIVTGEVLGQRPMSQRRWAMDLIDREAGVKGCVVRPLCAKLMEPTLAEKAGLIDREKLLAIRGRSRKEQIAWAAALGIRDYPAPAGGCLLTDPNYAHRLRELLQRGKAGVNDIELLGLGRHFRLDDTAKAVVGRDESENGRLEALARPGDLLFDAVDVPGPTVLLRGDASDNNVRTAAALTLKYGKARGERSARVVVRKAGTAESFDIVAAPATEGEAEALVVARVPEER